MLPETIPWLEIQKLIYHHWMADQDGDGLWSSRADRFCEYLI
jgi:hypothetical protein